MAVWVAGLLLAIYVPVYVSGLPADFIVKVSAHCGDGKSNGFIEVVSDLSVRVTAKCKNGLQLFNKTDGAHCIMPISFKDDGSARCVMERREGATVYSARVYVAWGQEGSPIITNAEQYAVSCAFGDYGVRSTAVKDALHGLIAPSELQFHNGPQFSSSVHLGLVDVKGFALDSNIPAQRKIQIKATTDGKDGEVGLRASSCDVVGINSNERYAILRAGCGDGIIFQKDQGFTTVGKSSFSPYFTSFHLGDDKDIKFDCNFTTCNTSCDGSSCRNERRRRDAPRTRENDVSMKVQSNIYSLVGREMGTIRHPAGVLGIPPKINLVNEKVDLPRPVAEDTERARPLAKEVELPSPLTEEDDLHTPLANGDDLPPQMAEEADRPRPSSRFDEQPQMLSIVDDEHRPFAKQNNEDITLGLSEWPILPWPAIVSLTFLCLMSLGLSLYSFVLSNRRQSVSVPA
ncbi:vitelline envelope sperm lysin receptor-like [Haliotis rufescens]|uniref:vitelline envelope sperm lysin receptor-like n=1 Tax=Haliotis rufescens TaxID=6454 RepID=UPI00201F7807|nr:vitelline envelope sperm lysin receptor-like [Haliotis rufescens]